MHDDFTRAVTELQNATERLLAATVLRSPDSRNRVVVEAVRLRAATEDVVAAAIHRAREDKASWKEIGDALGVSRQAAFQKYGKPIDPRTGEPMNTDPLPDAASLAEDVIDELATSQWSAVTSRFDPTMQTGLSEEALAAAWAQVIGQAGSFEGHGTPEAARTADVTTTNTPLNFEAADFVARITFRDDHTIAGLFIIDPAQA